MRRVGSGSLVLLLIGAMLMASVQNAAYASVISTEQYLSVVERQHAIEQIDEVLAHDEVQDRLMALGVDPAEASARVAALTDSELQTLAEDMQNLPAGGSLLGVVGVVFIVLLILELVGVIDIFNKI